jgi:hypothetical protein
VLAYSVIDKPLIITLLMPVTAGTQELIDAKCKESATCMLRAVLRLVGIAMPSCPELSSDWSEAYWHCIMRTSHRRRSSLLHYRKKHRPLSSDLYLIILIINIVDSNKFTLTSPKTSLCYRPLTDGPYGYILAYSPGAGH